MPNTGFIAWRRGGALLGALALVLAACTTGDTSEPTASPSAGPTDGGDGEIGEVVMLSSQLVPVEEQEKMRNTILANFGGEAEFIGADSGPFNDRIRAEGEAGSGDVSLIGGLHGEFASFAADDLLMDLSDVASELADLGINEQYLELGKLGTDQQLYIPWMQATYIMAARSEALEYLPEGADINALTWEQVTEWGANIEADTGERKLGFPAGEEGLWHRFFQGYAYPAFTGGLNTTFASEDAVAMWDWLGDTWQYVNPQATTYGFMQEPLQSGEVWVAWDHTARLIEALRNQPDEMVAFPAPAGPSGRAFMPVVAGLAIPNSAANPDGAKELIKYLLQPETQATTLSEVSFFPVITEALPGELEPGQQAEEQAVTTMTNASDALPALLPIGLGDAGGDFNKVFRDAFQQIILDGQDAATVLDSQAAILQEVLDSVEAACWPPDPESDGTCQVQ